MSFGPVREVIKRFATGASSNIRGRDTTWNTRILRAAGKLQELTYEMDWYKWNIFELCETRWRTLAKQQKRKDRKFSSVEERINTSMALDFLFTRTSWILSWDVAQFRAGRLITIRLRAVPFNIRLVQAYVPTLTNIYRCCRHSASHSGKWETTAGNVQQQQEFILQTKPAQIQQTHTDKPTQWARAAKKASKQCDRIVPINNQTSKICVSSALFNYRFRYIYTTN